VAVPAIGQSPNPLIPKTTPDLKRGKDGVVMINNETGKTLKKRVFAGGDVATGGATVILAMGQGRKAAKAIDEYLKTGQWQPVLDLHNQNQQQQFEDLVIEIQVGV
jgi:glutamate synthase (NADPH/NADH) small chain